MKFVYCIISLFIINNSFATTYYFSSVSGQDSYTSSQAQNINTPWKTINKLNSILNTLNAGDNILFKRGETFYGSIRISRSGISGNQIQFGAYGTGQRPIITGFTRVNSWNNLGNNIWESTNAVSNLNTSNMVTVQGVNTAMGRYPNTNWATVGTSTSTSITDPSLGATNWTGAEVVIKKERYIIDRSMITSQSGSRINFSLSAGGYSPKNNGGYFIQNDRRLLDVQNEWYYDPSSKKILVYSSGQPVNVQVASIDTLVTIDGSNYLLFDNISFEGSEKAGINLRNSKYISIQNCTISFCGGTAIQGSYHLNSTNLRIENCAINNSNNNSIDINSDFNNATIRNNIIENTSMLVGMGGNGDEKGNAIIAKGQGGIVEGNSIDNTGYMGIYFAGDNTIIKNNLINNFCMIKDDGGAIYTFNMNSIREVRKIQNNIILNGPGNNSGAVHWDGTKNNVGFYAFGIYLDSKTSWVEVSGNTIANTITGIYTHCIQDVQIVNNLCYNNKEQLYIEEESYSPAFRPARVKIENNRFIAKQDKQTTFLLEYLGGPDLVQTGWLTSGNNYYARPINETQTMLIAKTDYSVYGNRDLAWWQSYSSQDYSSKVSPKTITDPNDLRFEYNATPVDKTVSLGARFIDIAGKVFDRTITLLPYTSAVLIRDGVSTTPPSNPCANDQTPPTITAKNITVNLDASGRATIQPSDVIQAFTDNCTVDNASLQLSQSAFSCADLSTSSSTHLAYTAGTATGTQSFGGELGMEFTVNDANGIIIKQLGAFDHQGNGISGAGIRVAIFNKATRSIVPGLDAVITGFADGYTGNHRLKNITPGG